MIPFRATVLLLAVVAGLLMVPALADGTPVAATPMSRDGAWRSPVEVAKAAVSLAVSQAPNNERMWRWSYGPGIM